MPDKPVDSDIDPVVNSSLSVPLLVSTLILMLTLVWAVYDEVWTMRPWKATQAEFIDAYSAYLQKLKPIQTAKEEEVKGSSEYAALRTTWEELDAESREELGQLDRMMARGVTPRMAAARGAFQVLRSEMDAITYLLETSGSESAKESLREEIEEVRARVVEVDLPAKDGSGEIETVEMSYEQLQSEFLGLQAERARLQAERLTLSQPSRDARTAMDSYLTDNLFGLTGQQVDGLIAKMDTFGIDIKQIHLADIDLVDRCESCHLGVREPVNMTAAGIGSAVFASHPSKDLLDIHDPEAFGCTPCHNGNGRATRSAFKAHGLNHHWLWPMFEKDNIEAGCQQCHAREVVTEHADTLTEGRTLFFNKGCWGCHRFERFGYEAEELITVRQQQRTLEGERASNEKERLQSLDEGDKAADNDAAQTLYARAEELRLRNSRLAAELHSFQQEERHLLREVKKFGPSLKEIRVKDRKEWIPAWIKDPSEFRPGAKMPTFRLLDEEVQAISAYIWQNAIQGELEQHPRGNAVNGKELLETRGCLGCHSIGEGDAAIGGDFAANLTRVGEKTNYDFLVRWVHDPRELTPDPNTPDELRPTPLMPNLRLSTAEARDIATYLIDQKTDATYPAADFMDDPALAEEGLTLIRHYGCAGCHEISGLEEEGRIGTELTYEGSKPVERLDFALFTHPAESEGWYNHKGFFVRKLKDPSFFDQGKVRVHLEKLRMPDFHLSEGEITALTTFLLGALDTDLPKHYRYEPEDDRAAEQQGWWLVKRYNCQGCHQILPGDESSFMTMDRYEDPDWVEQLPPQLFNQGDRVQPDWLISFLHDPAQSETDTARNGVRRYLKARMPTFEFSDRQAAKLMKFFMARASQPVPYLPEPMEALSENERVAARALFTSRAAPCLRCHMTGQPAHDAVATAPNFLIASERLKADWTFRWLLEPAAIAPGTAMPSDLFRNDQGRWVFNGSLPAAAQNYSGDHADLLTRYMFQMTPAELNRLLAVRVQ